MHVDDGRRQGKRERHTPTDHSHTSLLKHHVFAPPGRIEPIADSWSEATHVPTRRASARLRRRQTLWSFARLFRFPHNVMAFSSGVPTAHTPAQICKSSMSAAAGGARSETRC